MFFKDTDGKCVMYSQTDNIAIMIIKERYEGTEELFESLLLRSIKGSNFVFDCAN